MLDFPGPTTPGIATQNAVEKSLAKEGKHRHDLGREKFVELVWQWREKYAAPSSSNFANSAFPAIGNANDLLWMKDYRMR